MSAVKGLIGPFIEPINKKNMRRLAAVTSDAGLSS
jgi:hypothetical protein